MAKKASKARPDAETDAGAENGVSKKRKKSTALDMASEVKFSTYIAKAHKAMHGKDLTIATDTLTIFDFMTDFVINKMVSNARKVNKYSKSGTLNTKSAHGAAVLTLTGSLKDEALGKAANAVLQFKMPIEETESVEAAP